MKYPLYVLAMILSATQFCAPVNADVWSDCRSAIEGNDMSAAKAHAETMLRFNTVLGEERIHEGLDCINFALDETHVFDRSSNSFISSARAIRQGELVDQDRQRREDREALKASRLIAVNAQKDKARMKVWRRLIEACEQLYKMKPDETISNKVCLDVFLETGLPE